MGGETGERTLYARRLQQTSPWPGTRRQSKRQSGELCGQRSGVGVEVEDLRVSFFMDCKKKEKTLEGSSEQEQELEDVLKRERGRTSERRGRDEVELRVFVSRSRPREAGSANYIRTASIINDPV